MGTFRQVTTDKFRIIDSVISKSKKNYKKRYRTKNLIFINGINENKILQPTMNEKANYNILQSSKI